MPTTKKSYCLIYLSDADDQLKAVNYYRSAAAQGHQDAQFQLEQLDAEASRLYKLGLSEPQGPKKLDFFCSAANLGHRVAQYFLAERYYRGNGIPKNVLTALFWYKESAAQGDRDAQYMLGQIYQLGQPNILANENKAIKYYKAAMDQGHKKAITDYVNLHFSLGVKYYTGNKVGVDKVKAVTYFKEAAAFENPSALNYLGIMYESGEGGLVQSYATAASLYRLNAILANALNNQGADYALGQNGVQEDRKQAIAYFKKAANLGNKYTQYNLALRYEKGIDIEKNVL